MATEQEREDAQATPLVDAGRPGEDLLVEANGLVNGDRQAAYGSPRPAYVAQAKVWSGLLAHKLKEDLTPEDVVLLLTGMKLVREVRKAKRDNRVDLVGYTLVLAHTREGEGGPDHVDH